MHRNGPLTQVLFLFFSNSELQTHGQRRPAAFTVFDISISIFIFPFLFLSPKLTTLYTLAPESRHGYTSIRLRTSDSWSLPLTSKWTTHKQTLFELAPTLSARCMDLRVLPLNSPKTPKHLQLLSQIPC